MTGVSIALRPALVAGLLLAAAGWSGGLFACTICVPFPVQTSADRLVEAEVAALARENPDRPFSYRITEVLKGAPQSHDVDLFLDSVTRRRLANRPDRSVLLVRSREDQWDSLGYADEPFEAMAIAVLERAECWRSDTPCDPSRVEWFAAYLGHENSRLHELAYLEVGRAPYRMIARLSHHWPAEEIRRMLSDVRWLEWYPLAILMLAHNGNEADRQMIRSRVEVSARVNSTINLSAWLTALIEIDREQAIERIEQRYFRDPHRDREQLLEVVKALSQHGSFGHVDLVPRIVESYRVLLEYHPAMASEVAADATRWRRWELQEAMAGILEEYRFDPLSAYAIRLYLSRVPPAH